MSKLNKILLISGVALVIVIVIVVAATAAKAFTGPGSNQPPDGSPSFWTLSGTDLYRSTGNIGIWNTTPTLPLDIRGAAGAPAVSGTTPAGVLTFGIGSGGNSLYNGMYSTSPYGSWFQVSNRADLSLNYPLILNPNGGNVGIATTTPESKLTVISASPASPYSAISALSGTTGGWTSVSVGRLTPEMWFGAAGGPNQWVTGTVAGDDAIVHSGKLHFGATIGGLSQIVFDTTGNIGIGTTAPGAQLDIYKSGVDADTTGGGLIVSRYRLDSNYRGGAIYSRYITGPNTDFLVFGVTVDNAKNPYSDFDQARMVIGANGNVGIGTTAPDRRFVVSGQISLNTTAAYGTGYAVQVGFIGGGSEYGMGFRPTTTGAASPLVFENSAGTVQGSIGINGSGATSFNTSSDRRLKENIVKTTIGLETLMKIPITDFNFISDPGKRRVQGFVAQDLYNYYPEAVSVGGENTTSSPWAVDYGRITPLLASSIQELNVKMENLKNENKELKDLACQDHPSAAICSN